MSIYSDWAEESYTQFALLSEDTTPERIKKNRIKVAPVCRKANKLKKVKDHEAFRLCYEWEHYFDEGYKSTENIDTLPEKLRVALLDMIEEG